MFTRIRKSSPKISQLFSRIISYFLPAWNQIRFLKFLWSISTLMFFMITVISQPLGMFYDLYLNLVERFFMINISTFWNVFFIINISTFRMFFMINISTLWNVFMINISILWNVYMINIATLMFFMINITTFWNVFMINISILWNVYMINISTL